MKTSRAFLLSIPVSLLLFIGSCTSGTLLSPHTLNRPEPVRGTYNLILYGGRNAHDLRTVAILDRNDDQYTIHPFGAAFNYRIIKDLPAAEAMERGNEFVSRIISYQATEKHEIYGPDHTVIGYELRPLLMPFTSGWLGDPLYTSYLVNGNNQITVYVGYKGEQSEDSNDNDIHGSSNRGDRD
jgi:hypothetical protein